MKTTNNRIASLILSAVMVFGLAATGAVKSAPAASSVTSGSSSGRGSAVTLSGPAAYGGETVQSTDYGTVDWSTAAQGYLTFTARGASRVLILEGPDGAQSFSEAAEGGSIQVTLTGGNGVYQYAIADISGNGTYYRILYKNSFPVNSLD